MKTGMGLLVFCFASAVAMAATNYVSLSGSHTSPFSSWATAANDIQSAVNAASAGDTVLVDDGVYLLSSEISVGTAITVQSVNGPDVTIVNGQGVSRGFNLGDAACTISGFTVTNGYASGDAPANSGGGIYCANSTAPVITNCTLSGNSAEAYGGGNYYGTLNNCTINGNSASSQGGGSFYSTLNNCMLSVNSAGDYGGGSMGGTLTDCTLSGNTARYGGGNRYGTLNNCMIISNSAAVWGGGSYQGTLNNSLFSGNSAYSGGGCRYSTLNNCTLFNNTTSGGNGGGSCEGTLNNCIVWGNTAGDVGQDIYSATVMYTCASDGVTHGTDGCITNNPLFVDAVVGNYRLQSASLCIDAGANAYVVGSTDLDGNDRIVNGAVDMGAYECPPGVNPWTVHYVSTNGLAVWPYNSWTDAATNIQDAVDAALAADNIVLVTNGTYLLSSEISVGTAITVRSVNGPDVTIVNGQGSCRGFNLGSTACIIDGFTLTNSYDSGNGGGIYCEYSTIPVITNCTLSCNSAGSYGGGIYYGTLIDCTLSGNTTSYGGGSCYSTLNNCTISGNSAGYGGGSYNGTLVECTLSGNLAKNNGGGSYYGTLTDCMLSGNIATNYGGGSCYGTLNSCTISNNASVKNYGGGSYDGMLTDCTLSGNSAEWGGGSYNGTLNNCTLSDNISHRFGGGSQQGTLNNCTLFGNTAAYDGGGSCYSTLNNCTLYDNFAENGGGSRGGILNNCIVWGNTVAYLYGYSDVYNPDACHYTCASDGVTHGADGCITNAPLFIDAAAGNCRLLSASPCIDAGTNFYAVGSTDLDGNDRIINGTVDMGAYEWISGGYTNTSPIHYVSTSGLAVWPYTNWIDAATSIHDAVSAAGDGDTVLVEEGIYLISSEITVGRAIMIQSMNGPDVTIINGQGASRGFNLGGTACIISGFKVTNGFAIGSSPANRGGGIYCSDATPFITNCILSANTAEAYGGGSCYGTLVDCTLSGNVASNYGGGIYYGTLTNCTLTGNSADGGGGSYWGTLTDCTLTANTANDVGGGSFWGTLTGCTLSDNTANDDGGGSYYGTLTNCTLSDNTAADNGGGSCFGTLNGCTLSDNIAAFGGGSSGSTLTNCTLSGNMAEFSGGGCSGGTLTDCTLVDNSAANGGGLYNCDAVCCDIRGNVADSDGGGAYDSTLENCGVILNSAVTGGGSRNGSIRNSVIAGNSSAGNGGGSFYSTLTNCTISANICEGDGGGTAWATAYNCIIVDNQPGNIHEGTVVWSCSPDLIHGSSGNITNDPALVSFSHIASDSPCVGMGNSSYSTGTDIDGDTWQNPPSIGCDEKVSGESATGNIVVQLITPDSVAEGFVKTVLAYVMGHASGFQIDFGDGTVVVNQLLVEHSWATAGVYVVTLTAYNDDYPAGISTSETVTVVGVDASAIHVSPTGSDVNDGSDWANAKATIQAGVDAQVYEGGFVFVDDGVYYPTGVVAVAKNIRIVSRNGASATTVDGGGTHGCFNLGQSLSILSELTIMNGDVTGASNNKGGGVYCENNAPVIEGCIIRDNEAGNGGGIHGGTVHECTLYGNTSSSSGGATYGSYITHSTIVNNYTSATGAGVYGGTVVHTFIADNTAVQYGGGVCYCTAVNCTIVNNAVTHPDSLGGGAVSSSLYNCIIYGNTAEQLQTYDNVYLCDVFNSCEPYISYGSNGNINGNPLFVSASDFHLQSSSPCVDKGMNSYVLSGHDLDGTPLPLDGDNNGTATVDIGCYEYIHAAADSDGDTLSDVDELNIYGTDPTNTNSDGDPMDDGDEYTADTDPADPADYFCITSVSNNSPFTVCFKSSALRDYTLLGRTNLTSGSWQTLLGPRAGVGGADSMTDNSSSPAYFYKLRVDLP